MTALGPWQPDLRVTYWAGSIAPFLVGGPPLIFMVSHHETRVLCELSVPNRKTNCDEMDTGKPVRRGLSRNGPDPSATWTSTRMPAAPQGLLPDRHGPVPKARRVNQPGKMAVVLEMSLEPFVCSAGKPDPFSPFAGRHMQSARRDVQARVRSFRYCSTMSTTA